MTAKPSTHELRSSEQSGTGIALGFVAGVCALMALRQLGEQPETTEARVAAANVVPRPVQVTVPAPSSSAADRFAKISAYSALATALIALLTALVAAGALWFAKEQIATAAQVQHEASARDAFKEYLKTAIEHPEMAEARLLSDNEQFKERAGYEWFVSYFLFSAEQVYLAFPNDDGWRRAIAEQVCYHKKYLRSEDFQQRVKLHYDEGFAKLLDDSLRNSCK